MAGERASTRSRGDPPAGLEVEAGEIPRPPEQGTQLLDLEVRGRRDTAAERPPLELFEKAPRADGHVGGVRDRQRREGRAAARVEPDGSTVAARLSVRAKEIHTNSPTCIMCGVANRTTTTRLVNFRLPHDLLERLDRETANRSRTSFVISAIERALTVGDSDPYIAGKADGFEHALQILQGQRWRAQRTGQLIKEGKEPTAAMAQASEEWSQKVRIGNV